MAPGSQDEISVAGIVRGGGWDGEGTWFLAVRT